MLRGTLGQRTGDQERQPPPHRSRARLCPMPRSERMLAAVGSLGSATGVAAETTRNPAV